MTKRSVQSGVIRVTGMRFWGRHGANPGEQRHEQPIDVDVSLKLDLRAAARTDALARTIDYSEIYRTCERIVTKRSFQLLESIAQTIAEDLWPWPKVLALRVRVRKPRLLEGATPEIEIIRRRSSE